MFEDLATRVLASEPQKKVLNQYEWKSFLVSVCESKMKLNLASFIPEVVVLTYQRQCGC
jgi:hypothetical protein